MYLISSQCLDKALFDVLAHPTPSMAGKTNLIKVHDLHHSVRSIFEPETSEQGVPTEISYSYFGFGNNLEYTVRKIMHQIHRRQTKCAS